MLLPIRELPDNVLGFEGRGEVTGTEYETVLMPAVEKMLCRCGSVRFLYHLGNEFTGFDARAMWDDARVGLQHINAWERVAVVTDVRWIRIAIKLFGGIIPGHVRIFGNNEFVEARQWVSDY